MQIIINKKTIICVGIIILMCAASFLSGRYIRVRGASDDGIRAEQQLEQLTGQYNKLYEEFQSNIERCESLQGQLDRVGDGIDESIRTAGSIRTKLEQSRLEIKGSHPILNELRTRFVEYENRIKQLEDDLGRIKEGSSEQQR